MSKIYGNMIGGAGLARTYILQDSDGNEAVATYVDSETKFDATANDIRAGKIAATEIGVTIGQKEIPGYHTDQGVQIAEPGERLEILMYSDRCDYTKLMVIVCSYNTTVDDSVSAVMAVINDKLYSAGSTAELSDVIVDTSNKSINLGVINNTETPLVIRYMTIKEEP